jgi:aldehyde dehydrogenase (NAD+)
MKLFETARAQAARLRETPVRERVARAARLREVILRDREAIIERLQLETGKCRSDALMSEIFPVLDFIHYLEKNAEKALSPRKVPTPIALMGKKSLIRYEPLGVVLVISPWNYPFYQAIVPCLSAYVAGNAVVYKPSEHTPLKGLVEETLAKAGFADGEIQVVYGDGALGAELISQRPDKVFFTGSVGTGRRIMAQAASLLIPVELELGGKDPMIVFDDANPKRAAAGAAWGALTNCGQSCTSVERVYVQKGVYPAFREALLAEIGRVRQAVDRDGAADIGRMTTDFQVRVVAEQLRAAEAEGARVLTGAQWDRKSRAIPPIVLEGVRDEMPIVAEETFGPVIPLLPFDTEDEAVERANRSRYALSASVWSRDLARAERVAARLVTGNVSINNVMLTEANPALPFGGLRDSGFGRYKGEAGFHAFSNVKSVLVDKDSAKIEANWFPYTPRKYALFARMMEGLFGGGIGGFARFAVSGMKLESYANQPPEKLLADRDGATPASASGSVAGSTTGFR